MSSPAMPPRGVPEVVPATPGDQPLLAQLLEEYAREFSHFHPVEFNQDGRFVYRDLPAYWQEPGRFPFLIRVENAVAGFALVRRLDSRSDSEPVFDIAEFFVAPTFRRRGVATSAAHQAWTKFPALWQVRVLEANQPAMRFWENAITRFTDKAAQSVSFTVRTEAWRRFSFDSRSVAQSR